MAEEYALMEAVGDANDKKNTSFFSRVWNGLFRLHGDDFEKRLQYISKEEAALLDRMNRRSLTWRATARNIIVVSVILEVVAVASAIMTTRTVILDWKLRVLRVLPIFLLPGLSSAFYWALLSFTRMCDVRDQKTLERLRAERQAKIDELKERTNYYTTQQLIQRYDPDPAAKAAAASVLASKLGADSGLRMYLEDESQYYPKTTWMSNDIEPVKSSGLRRRNPSDARSRGSSVVPVPSRAPSRGTSVVPVPSRAPSRGTSVVPVPHSGREMFQYGSNMVSEAPSRGELVVEHQNSADFGAQEGGWIARVAALLVGEDPTQSYALICGNCHMHNGLAMKEDFPVITYYCPHCRALNKPRTFDENSPSANTLDTRSPTHAGAEFSEFTSQKASGTTSPAWEREPFNISNLPPRYPTNQ